MGDQMRRAWEDFARRRVRRAAGPARARGPALGRPADGEVRRRGAAQPRASSRCWCSRSRAPRCTRLFPELWAERGVARRSGSASSRAAARERLVREVLGEPAPRRARRAARRARGGNAFYLEELIRAVAEGARRRRSPETRARDGAGAARGARAGGAPRAARGERASARCSGAAASRALLGGDATARALARVARASSCEREADRARGARRGSPARSEYAFRHALVREAAYAMLTDDDRALGHRLAGAWLERGRRARRDRPRRALRARRRARARASAGTARAAEQALEGNDLAAALARAERGDRVRRRRRGARRAAPARRPRRTTGAASSPAPSARDEGDAALPEGGAPRCRAACVALWASHLVGREDGVVALARALCCAVVGGRRRPRPEAPSPWRRRPCPALQEGPGRAETRRCRRCIDAVLRALSSNDPTVTGAPVPAAGRRIARSWLAGRSAPPGELGEALDPHLRGARATCRGACGAARQRRPHFCNELGAYARRRAPAPRRDRPPTRRARSCCTLWWAFAKENLGRTLSYLGASSTRRAPCWTTRPPVVRGLRATGAWRGSRARTSPGRRCSRATARPPRARRARRRRCSTWRRSCARWRWPSSRAPGWEGGPRGRPRRLSTRRRRSASSRTRGWPRRESR